MFTDFFESGYVIDRVLIDSNSIVKRKLGLEHRHAQLNRYRKDDGVTL